ncbi:rhamnogalacturonan lyase [Roseiconus nitratireducens]|uniref:Rhamnogalacturonan lyase n=1 Tax=Roseiconus nitratireducens TaxID=2605748 RepID=A0A5M6DAF1_9BACT|nr:rhamnogalacturonan lyase [Roseiconus nitratireducens]KAA5544353.1 rhamnogalacturonan lyase [Roseiconus nitratireducens]
MCRPSIAVLSFIFLQQAVCAQRLMEKLDRGVVAVQNGDEVFIGWRLFATEPPTTGFNVYRADDDGEPRLLNDQPLTAGTNFVDTSGDVTDATTYFVRPVLDGQEGEPSDRRGVDRNGYLEFPIQPVDGYRAGDASVADLDGDGDYELVLHQINNPKDNSHAGLTGSPILDAYEFDGTLIWRIDLGRNIREGEHYTQFMVYDLDGDGSAEVACKTADGTVDGRGTVIGDATKDYRVRDSGSRSFGRVLDGPEFLTVFSGRTGEALQTVDYIPGRDPIDGWGGIGGNGGNDSYGNRCDRFLACVAYLDGVRPSLVMCRGVYGRTVMAAWDWRDGELRQRWVFDSGISYPPYKDASKFSGMGGHSLSVADVDADGRDEIVYQAMVVDDDGEGLYSTGLRHGDAMHVSDMYPDRPGLEVFTVQENEDDTTRFQTPGAAMRDAETGEILWSHSPGTDVGSGLAADIDPRHRGFEAWGGPGGLRDSQGESIGRAPRSSGYAIWWDGDLLRELVGRRGQVTKWDWEAEQEVPIFAVEGRGAPRGPNLIGDILGDWREEIVVASPDGKSLRIYTTTIPTDHRLYTLMQDPQYRLSITWQNVVYNKPPHTSFFLGHGMSAPPVPDIRIVGP